MRLKSGTIWPRSPTPSLRSPIVRQAPRQRLQIPTRQSRVLFPDLTSPRQLQTRRTVWLQWSFMYLRSTDCWDILSQFVVRCVSNHLLSGTLVDESTWELRHFFVIHLHLVHILLCNSRALSRSGSRKPRKILHHIVDQLPDRFPVSVVMQRIPVKGNRWIDHRWEVVGVTGGRPARIDTAADLPIHETEQPSQTLYPGLEIKLFLDQCESYYHNLLAPRPVCYVVVRRNDAGIPFPALVSASFDEANAYLEADEEVFPVDLQPELYRWVEAFVLEHYVPQKRFKRRLDGETGGETS